MINRIVKLTFDEQYADDFKNFSKKIKGTIKSFEGCRQLDILQDKNDPNTFFTYSCWENEFFLNNYRESDFFKNIWPKTKKWFSDKPQAWSTETI
jgi:quinol monooxygenase YgiN